MASGSGERPLGSVSQEKTLLGLSGFQTRRIEMANNVTRYIVFEPGVKNGLLFLTAQNSQKQGMYSFASTTTSQITLVPFFPVTQSGLSVSATDDYITVVNPASNLFLFVIMITGNPPTVSSTQPT